MISLTRHRLYEHRFQWVTIHSFIDLRSENESCSCLLSVHEKITQLYKRKINEISINVIDHFPVSQVLAVWFLNSKHHSIWYHTESLLKIQHSGKWASCWVLWGELMGLSCTGTNIQLPGFFCRAKMKIHIPILTEQLLTVSRAKIGLKSQLYTTIEE